MKNFSKTTKVLFLSAFALLFFQSCKKDVVYETVRVQKQFSVEIPTMLLEAQTLHEEASLQYQNLLQELYVIVLNESKADINQMIHEEEALSNFTPDFEGYVKLVTENMELRVRLENVSELEDLKINGLNAKIQTFETDIEGHTAYYRVGFIEGKKDYYQVMTWTLKSKQDAHEEKMIHMVQSFRELKN
jgi:hypothetical protein